MVAMSKNATCSPAENHLVPSTKACVSCRALKVRCTVEINNAFGTKRCQRCVKADRDCVFPATQKKKPRKRTDIRVTDLENEIRSMKSLYGGNANTSGSSNNASLAAGFSESSINTPPSLVNAGQVDSPNSLHEEQPAHLNFLDNDAELITPALAEELYETYNSDLVEHYPVVTFPEGYSVELLRIEKPTLFLGIMAAAAKKSHPQISFLLSKKIRESFALRIFMNGENSMELVHAMIIAAVWYTPPEGSNAKQQKFYEYIHMAVTMALDLGLGTRSSQTKDCQVSEQEDQIMADYENKRTFLSCYVICCGVALSLRRPNMLRYNSWIAECARRLLESQLSRISDQRLVAWAQLLSISEEFALRLPREETDWRGKLLLPETCSILKEFENRLGNWRVALSPGIMNGPLEIWYHQTSIYLHEVTLYRWHSPSDFVPPFSFENLQSEVNLRDNHYHCMQHADLILRCVSSSHALLEAFLHIKLDLLRTLPIFNYIRLAYTIFVLEVIAASTSSSAGMGSDIHGGGAEEWPFTHASLQIDHYLQLITHHLEQAIQNEMCKVPLIFLGLMRKLQGWHAQSDAVATMTTTRAAATAAANIRTGEPLAAGKDDDGQAVASSHNRGVTVVKEVLAPTPSSSSSALSGWLQAPITSISPPDIPNIQLHNQHQHNHANETRSLEIPVSRFPMQSQTARYEEPSSSSYGLDTAMDAWQEGFEALEGMDVDPARLFIFPDGGGIGVEGQVDNATWWPASSNW